MIHQYVRLLGVVRFRRAQIRRTSPTFHLTFAALVILSILLVGAWFHLTPSLGAQLALAASPPLQRAGDPIGAGDARANPILVTENGFAPAIFTTTVGAPVTWLNTTQSTHVLRSGALQRVYLPLISRDGGSATATGMDDHSAGSGDSPLFAVDLPPGMGFTFAFTVTGIYPYYLETAPGFSGLIVVVPATQTVTPTATPTATPLNTSTQTATPTRTPTSTSTQTAMPTTTATSTSTATPTETATATSTSTSTATPTETATSTSTSTATPTETATSTSTSTATPTETATATSASTATPTETATATATNTPTPTEELPPPNPEDVAPPLDQTTSTNLLDATAFLYTGDNPIQTGVVSGTIEVLRAAVLRGKVTTRDNAALPGVRISVLDHPEFGQTLTRADGMFDLAVNGGGQLVVNYQHEGFLPAQRQVSVPWQNYAWLPDVVLIPLDSVVTTVDLGAPTLQVARGSVVSDTDGMRQATIFFPQGMTATLVLSDGTTSPLTTLNIRATEYTVGANGPSAMPGELPPSSGYTYAVELSADEAIAADAEEVRFSSLVPFYVENFVGFPVGALAPTGFYDRARGQWLALDNGRVLQVLSITAGLADLDLDGTGTAAEPAALAALGITDEERQRLAALYAPGQSLWRVLLPHLTPWDINWPYGPPPGALPPGDVGPEVPKPPKDPNKQCGSIIGCETQTLGEIIAVTGVPWTLHYQSDRAPGRGDMDILKIRLSGATLPPDLEQIHLELTVAGQIYKRSFAPQPNLFDTFTWDGKDAYGRTVQGHQPVKVRIGYEYAAQYYATPDTFAASFNRFGLAPIAVARGGGGGGGGAVVFSRSPLRTVAPTITLWQNYAAMLGNLDALDLGGWTLRLHHAYDVAGQTLYLGNGDRRRAEALPAVIKTVAGTGVGGYTGDGGPATSAKIAAFWDVASGPDGSLYMVDSDHGRIRRVGPDGIITTFAGNGSIGLPGDGGPATAATLVEPMGVAVGPDGSVYIADHRDQRIRRVGTDGIITTVAGNGVAGTSGDGGPALEANLNFPLSVAVGPDGSLYIVNANTNRVRRVGPDGIIVTIAGTGTAGFSGDGGPATMAQLNTPRGIAVGPDGSLYIAESGNNRIRRVSPDGIIATVAGNGGFGGFSGDGGPATAALLGAPYDVAVSPDGSLYIADWRNNRIRRVGPDGIITTVAGNDSGGFSGDYGPATAASLSGPVAVATSPAGSLYVADKFNFRIRHVAPELPDIAASDIVIAAEDGSEIYVFDGSGRHLRTLDALTGALRYQFNYGVAGHLVAVTDGYGNIATIEHTGATPTAIVAPGGQRTMLSVNNDGWLASVANPAGETHTMSYTVDGLLQQFVDPRGNAHHFTYDALGRLSTDEDPVGGSTTLARIEVDDAYTVTTTSALGRSHAYQVEQLPTGAIQRSVTAPSGVKTVTLIGADGSEQITYADGTVVTVQYGPDPRWGMLAPVAASVKVQTPGGRIRTVTTQRSVKLAIPTNLLSLTRMTDTITENGAVSTLVYDAIARVLTTTSAAGRSATLTIDAQGRTSGVQIAGLAVAGFAYDNRGLLSAIIEGSGVISRVTGLAYDGAYNLIGFNDALGRTMNLAYDPAGRPITQMLPNGQTIAYAYDANGNMSALTPPGRPAHTFDYTAIDQLSQYTPPDVNPGSDQTEYSYNADRRLTVAAFPDGQTTAFAYDSAGRLSTTTIARGQFGYSYNPTSGHLTVINAPAGINLAYNYDGPLLTGKSWSGPIVGSVGYVYDNRFRVTSISVNGGNAITFQYASDSILTQAGALVLSRNAQNGLLTGSTLGGVTDVWSYNGFAEPTNYSAAYNAAPLYNVQYDRDKLGRITQKSETIGGATDVYSYTYDLAGRLTGVQKNGLFVEEYSYDANGNRLSAATSGGVVAGVYDAQDRLVQYGVTTYSYTAAGELVAKTTGAQTTTYSYDELGNLVGVTLPDETAITYLVDGQNQRIGKRVNGALVQGFLYESDLRPVAELDGSGAVVSRFVYATHANVPDYMVKGGVTYRILTDHLGSPRLVVNTLTGVIVQRLDYDSFGNVLADTNPGFQPFGFAGGLYDLHTKLVRFGARDFDANTGRWTAKDPILFNGNDTNLYAYGREDPVNHADLNGMKVDVDCIEDCIKANTPSDEKLLVCGLAGGASALSKPGYFQVGTAVLAAACAEYDAVTQVACVVYCPDIGDEPAPSKYCDTEPFFNDEPVIPCNSAPVCEAPDPRPNYSPMGPRMSGN